MTNDLKIALLPIGELNSGQVRIEFSAIFEFIRGLTDDTVIINPVSDEVGAQQALSQLSDELADLLVIIPLRGRSAQTIETAARTLNIPSLIWPISGEYALPSSALATGALHETGFPVEMLYAPPNHTLATKRFQDIARAARTYSRLRQSRIGLIGGLFPNLVSCRYDPEKLILKFGITLLPVTFDEVRSIMQDLRRIFHNGELPDRKIYHQFEVNTQDKSIFNRGIQLHLALKQLTSEKQLDGIVAECWTGFPRELGMNPCLGFLEDAYTLACEGDLTLMIALLMIRYLTGVYSFVGDIYDLDLEGNLILVHCGAPASLATKIQNVKIEKSCAAHAQGFETITCKPLILPGPVTLLRLYGLEGNQLHIALGDLIQCETSPDLKVTVRLSGDRWHFLEHCFGNHYVVAPGDIREELQFLCKWLGIKVIET